MCSFFENTRTCTAVSMSNQLKLYPIKPLFDLTYCQASCNTSTANISYLHIYVQRSLTEPPDLNLPVFLQWRFRAQPPNLTPTNISGYIVYPLYQPASGHSTAW